MKFAAVFLAVLCLVAACQAWTCSEAPSIRGAVKVDAGLGSVVVTTRYKWSYMLMNNRWIRIGRIRTLHATTGLAGTWLIDIKKRVWKLTCGAFTLVKRRAGFTWMDGGADDAVVGVSKKTTFCGTSHRALAYRKGVMKWTNLKKKMTTIACGKKKGCWSTDSKHRVWVSKKVNADKCKFSKWVRVKGSLKMVEVSTFGQVFGVNKKGHVYQRLGITNKRRQGKRWRRIPMCTKVRHVAYDHGKLWVVTKAGMLMRCVH